jgi:mannose-6-phosphate isomerase-like protein (cupin superfamily)
VAVKYTNGEASERPWGRWQVLDTGRNHVVKRLTVNPGGRLSLQYHHHREEHWGVVEGTATVTLDDEIFEAGSGAVIFVPVGNLHTIENRGVDRIEFIEVQLGDDLREDDIVRLEDPYGRG